MKAILVNRYGPPESIVLADLPRPVPGKGQVLVRIRAATVSAGDMRLRSGQFPRGMALPARLALGITGPRRPVLGTDLAGEVVALGPGAQGVAVGDRILAFVGVKMGGHAEYRAVPLSAPWCPIPDGMDWATAAAVPFGGTTALYFLRDRASVQPSDRVLVVGASGAVGSAAVQLARHWGAHVTAVTSTANLALVHDLGAAEAIDYRTTDWASLGRRWDVILDTTGTVDANRARPCLPPGGRLALVAADLPQMLGGLFARGIRVLTGVASERAEDLRLLVGLAEEGAFRPLIDRTFPLDQAAAAHAHVATGRKRGNVVLVMDGLAAGQAAR